jgi:hypothetical protein
MIPRIDVLSDQKRAWLQSQLEDASQFVRSFVPERASGPFLPEVLDLAWGAWLQTDETDDQQIRATIDAVAVAFGQILVDEGLLSWVVVTDEQGSVLALHGLPGQGDVLVYPTEFVARRWEDRQTRFFRRSFHQISRHVRSLASPSQPKPEE